MRQRKMKRGVPAIEGRLVLDRLFRRAEKDCNLSIAEVPPGKTVRTGGGSVGVITGRQTQNAVQIKILEGELKGEYDWMSKTATVKEVTSAGSESKRKREDQDK